MRIGPQLTKDEYFALELDSASKIKDYAYSPLFYKKKYIDKVIPEKKDKSLDFGTIFDLLLLTPEEFTKNYHIFDQPLTEAVTLLCEGIRDDIKSSKLKNLNNFVIKDKIKELNLFSNITKDETIMKKIADMQLLNIVTKYVTIAKPNIVSSKLYHDVEQLVGKVLTDALVGYHFDDNYLKEEDCERVTQFSYLFTYNDLPLKTLLDMVIIDHKNKTITGTDVKTMQGNTTGFIFNYYKYRYDLQGLIYYEALLAFQKIFYPSYTVQDFEFLVISTTDNFAPPTFYPINAESRGYARHGRAVNNVYLQGLDQLCESLLWSKENNVWDYHKLHYENKAKQHLYT